MNKKSALEKARKVVVSNEDFIRRRILELEAMSMITPQVKREEVEDTQSKCEEPASPYTALTRSNSVCMAREAAQ